MPVMSHDAVYLLLCRLKEISSKYESQKGQLSEANKNIVTMKAEVAVKEKEIETCNKRYKYAYYF